MAETEISINGIRFANPVMPAAGPNVRTGAQMLAAAAAGAGGIVSKTVSLSPARDPRPTIRSVTARGLINCETWSEMETDAFLQELLLAKSAPVPLIVSVGYSPREVGELGRLIDAEISPAAFEFSTHYTGKDSEPLLEVARSLRKAVRAPIWMKLSPNFPGLEELARRAAPLVDAFVAVNSYGPVLDFDIESGAPLLGSDSGQGWLSGPPLLPIALGIVRRLAEIQDKPVIGVGGIRRGSDAVKYLQAGAAAVQVCSAAIREGHEVYGRIAAELAGWLDDHGYAAPEAVRGLFARRLAKRRLFIKQPLMTVDPELCTGCEACQTRCIQGALSMRAANKPGADSPGARHDKPEGPGIAAVDPELCIGCGFCQDFCGFEAMALKEDG
jgi:dihydroorotate dehydrogenase/Pyruvate/2-oxoacid:ferredoxin oxidoreductase delta subunit